MTWTLYLDDERWPKTNRDWTIARTKLEVELLVKEFGMPFYISFDHDLGYNEPTGLDVAEYLVYLDLDGICKFPSNFEYNVHSANPVGAKNIRAYLDNYLKFKNNS